MSPLRIALLVLTMACATAHASSPISHARAEATALRMAPGGEVVRSGLERAGGRLVWLVDVSVPGSRNVREIRVDGQTGAVLSNTLETPTDR